MLARSLSRGAAAAAAAAAPAKGVAAAAAAAVPVIRFKAEPADVVAREVPDFSMYEFKDGQKSPYGEIYMDRPAVESRFASAPVDAAWQQANLENGFKIVASDRGGETANISLFVNVGPRFESHATQGSAHMLEIMAFRSTAHLSHLRTAKTLEQMGAGVSVELNREYLKYSISALREHLPFVVPMLIGNVLFPRILPWELTQAQPKFNASREELYAAPDQLSNELMHQAAYNKDTLGRAILATHADRAARFNGDWLRRYMLDNFSPDRMAIVGTNVTAEELGTWSMRSFADYQGIAPVERQVAKAAYKGGFASHEINDGSGVSHLTLAYEVPGGWSGAHVAQSAVLQSVLATRIAKDVLTKNAFVDDMQALSQLHSDSGLFGVHASCGAAHGRATGQVMKDVLAGAAAKVSDDEVVRAKKAIAAQVISAVDSPTTSVADIGEQIMLAGTGRSAQEIVASINGIGAKEVQASAKKIVESKPTVVVVGDCSQPPHLTDF